MDNNATDLEGMFERLGTGPVHLVGYSYGGFISALLASRRPDLVRSLVLVEPAASRMLVASSRSQAQLLGLLLRSPSVALATRRFQSTSLHRPLRALDRGEVEEAVRLNV